MQNSLLEHNSAHALLATASASLPAFRRSDSMRSSSSRRWLTELRLWTTSPFDRKSSTPSCRAKYPAEDYELRANRVAATARIWNPISSAAIISDSATCS